MGNLTNLQKDTYDIIEPPIIKFHKKKWNLINDATLEFNDPKIEEMRYSVPKGIFFKDQLHCVLYSRYLKRLQQQILQSETKNAKQSITSFCVEL